MKAYVVHSTFLLNKKIDMWVRYEESESGILMMTYDFNEAAYFATRDDANYYCSGRAEIVECELPNGKVFTPVAAWRKNTGEMDY